LPLICPLRIFIEIFLQTFSLDPNGVYMGKLHYHCVLLSTSSIVCCRSSSIDALQLGRSLWTSQKVMAAYRWVYDTKSPAG